MPAYRGNTMDREHIPVSREPLFCAGFETPPEITTFQSHGGSGGGNMLAQHTAKVGASQRQRAKKTRQYRRSTRTS